MKRTKVIFLTLLAFFMAGSHVTLQAAVAETHRLAFRIGSSKLDTLYNNNAGACARINKVLETAPDTRITISACSSPDGKTSRNLQLARQRAQSVKEAILAMNPGIEESQIVLGKAEEDWTGVKKYLERSNKDWKEEALKILEDKEGDKKALLQDLWVGEAWEDLMKNCFPTLRNVTVHLIGRPETSENSSLAFQTPVINFKNGSSKVLKSIFDNATGLENLQLMAKSGASDLYVYVKSSPEGNEKGNERLGLKRGESIKQLLRKEGYTGEIHIIYQGEDWAGLAQAVEASADIPDKDAVLEILADTSLSRNSRKKALQGLSYGKTWLRMLDVEMSGLRTAYVTDSAQ